VTSVSGPENGAIPLTISAAAADGDETVTSINIAGIPAGATLNAGTLNSDASYTLTPAQLAGLQLNAGETGGTLHVTAMTSEGNSSATASVDVAVTVTPVAEPANLSGTVTAVSGGENGAIPLTMIVNPADSDDLLGSITISGVPAGAALNAGTLNSDGSYTLTPAQLTGLQLDPGLVGGVLHVVATTSEGSSTNSLGSIDISVAVSGVFEFVYTYADGKDYYQGTVADNGTFGYHAGEVITLPAGGQYQITGQVTDPNLAAVPTSEAAGTVFVTDYSHGGFGEGNPVPQKNGANLPDGIGGLGTEADTVLGIDGVAHPFSPTVEVNFPSSQLFGFVFNYADGSAYYSGTVADNGSQTFGALSGLNFAVVSSTTQFTSTPTYAQVAAAGATVLALDPVSNNVVGTYILFAEGQTTDAAGTVRLQSYADGASGQTLSLNNALGGTTGLGAETGSITSSGTTLAFSALQELIDPPTPASPPVLGNVPSTVAYTAGQQPVAVSPGLTLSDDSTSTILSATVSITNGSFAGDGDVLSASGLAGTVITQSYNAATETLTLSGSDTLADYQKVLDSVVVGSTDSDPTLANQDPFRTIQLQATDDNGLSGSATTTLLISPPTTVPAPVDFFGDGKSDLLWRNPNNSFTVLWQMNGLQQTSSTIIAADPNWSFTGAGDFDGSGKDGILWTNPSSGMTVMWQMNGSQLANSTIIAGDPNWKVLGIGDFTGDGKDDLLWHNAQSNFTVLWQMNGTQVGASSILASDPNWAYAGEGDFFGNGTDDILWHNAQSGMTVMWQMAGGQVIGSNVIAGDPNWTIAGIGDFNGDGKSDILWHNAKSGFTVMWQMNGFQVQSSTIVGADPNWAIEGVGDFNGDGKSDILWYNAPSHMTVMWQMNGTQVANSAIVAGDPNWNLLAPGR
jgi:hypothetical protein